MKPPEEAGEPHPTQDEALFRRLAETTSAAIFIYQGSRFRYVNRATEVITGYGREELLAMNFWEIVHPEFRELVKERAAARLRGEDVPSRYECAIVTKSGEARWIDITAATMVFEGSPAGLGTACDITARKQAEEQLRQLASLVNEDPNPVIETDPSGSIAYLNRAARQAFPDIVQAGLRHPMLQAVTVMMGAPGSQQKPVFVPEVACGREIYEERIVAQGGLLRIYAREITERKKALEQWRISQEQLRALYQQLQSTREREKARIAQEVHDDLGQVLAYVKLSLCRLAGELPEDRKETVRRIEEVSHSIDFAIQSVRRMHKELRPPVMDVLGLESGLQWQARRFRGRTKIPCRLIYGLKDQHVDRQCCTAIFRICQELLEYVGQCARTTSVDVEVTAEQGDLVLKMNYRGEGRESEDSHARTLRRLEVRERVLALGGDTEVQENSPEETRIRVRVPVKEIDRQQQE